MARKSTPEALTLANAPYVDEEHDFILDSPRTPLSTKSPKSPRSPFKFTTTKKADLPPTQTADPLLLLQARTNIPPSQTTVSLSALQPSSARPGGEERQGRPSRGGFFSNYKASKSSSRLQSSDSVKALADDAMSRDTDHPAIAGKVSSQEVNKLESGANKAITRRPVGAPAKSDPPAAPSDSPSPPSTANVIKKNKPKPFSLLGRTKSIRDEPSPPEGPPNIKLLEPEGGPNNNNNISLKTAPLVRPENDRTLREIMTSNVRQRSEDRQTSAARDMPPGRDVKDSGRTQSSSYKESGGHAFLYNLKSSATKGAGAIHKGLFGKSSRRSSTTEKETPVDDEHYQLKVINLPLVEQTRLTRISKKLEDSRDKTEFWMPAFPWRAIDYLNYKGSDVEGLYRVPGSGPQIKRWQRRFDEEQDIDLFEQDDLYDINIIGSMLKAWLRELPDELFPKAAQDRISREGSGSETVPQILIDELSNLSPFNYYLLFAITCHLSLLLAHSEKNKMDFRNLCICFQPCMKIDAFCFKFLVCDWRDCWKGCKTEAYYIEEEYKIFEEREKGDRAPNSAEGRSSTAVESHDERNVSSSDSSKPSSVSVDKEGKWGQGQWNGNGIGGDGKVGNKKLPLSHSQSGTVLTVVQERTPPTRSTDMRPLSPIKPLSPIGF